MRVVKSRFTYDAVALVDKLKKWHSDNAKKTVKLKKLMQIVDENIHEFFDNGLKSGCKKGCSACCYYNVDITPLEADLIAEFTGRKIVSGHTGNTVYPSKCPFLVDNACSIYPVRPYMCRSYIAVTPDPDDGMKMQACNSLTVAEYEHAPVQSIERNPYLVAALVSLAGSDAVANEIRDIRHFFPD